MNYEEFTDAEHQSVKGSEERKMYMFLTGKGEGEGEDTNNANIKWVNKEGQFRGDDAKKEDMINIFNKAPLDSRLNVIILNSAAAEGITLKKVNYVHLLQIPANMSRLYQIVGRAVRNCTHSSLDNIENQFVTPILYVATHPSIPDDQNRDILRYEKIVQYNDRNLPYLKLLKQAAIDCTLNKEIPGNESLVCNINPKCPVVTPNTSPTSGHSRTLSSRTLGSRTFSSRTLGKRSRTPSLTPSSTRRRSH